MVLKRKQSVHSTCIDTKKTITAKKPPSKADLVQELKEIKKINYALEEENQKNLDMLDNHKLVKELNDALLEEVKDIEKAIANHIKEEKEFLVKIKNLAKGLDEQENCKHPRADSETQTSAYPEDSVLLACNLCI